MESYVPAQLVKVTRGVGEERHSPVTVAVGVGVERQSPYPEVVVGVMEERLPRLSGENGVERPSPSAEVAIQDDCTDGRAPSTEERHMCETGSV